MKKMILVIGAESSGTRIFGSLLSNHPDITGMPEQGHKDILDETWRLAYNGHLEEAAQSCPDAEVILTRRSVPHALEAGRGAHYMEMPSLMSFKAVCNRTGHKLIMLVTTRSPDPNLNSWSQQRHSAKGSRGKAMAQYQHCYKYLLNFAGTSRIQYWILSLEGLLLDGDHYLNGIYKLLDLPTFNQHLDLKKEINLRRYTND